MEEKNLDMDLSPDLDLESIISEFSMHKEKADVPVQESEALPEPAAQAVPAKGAKLSPEDSSVPQAKPAPQNAGAAKPETAAAPEEKATAAAKPEKTEAAAALQDTQVLELPKKEAAPEADSDLRKTRILSLGSTQNAAAPDSSAAKPAKAPDADTATRVLKLPKQEQEASAPQTDARSKLQLLKAKLVAGPEKRYYDLSEQGLGRLQAAVIIGLIITGLCLAMAALFELDMIPQNRMRFVIFTQILAMLVSALIGNELMIDSVSDLFRGRFTPNFLLVITFLACLADAVACLIQVRVPCCGAFALSMTFALLGRYYARATEMSQMDSLRKAVTLVGLTKQKDYLDGKSAVIRSEGELEDVWDTYKQPTAPEKVQSVFCIAALFLSIAIAALGTLFGGFGLGVQALANSLMIAVPAGAFIALTRPANLLEKRLHMVGTVLCGWRGVKLLRGKALFPITDNDLFPAGTTKLNGVKFYGNRRPDDVMSYTGSVIIEAENPLSPVFAKVMENRHCAEQAVLNFKDYGVGFSGEVRGETVLVGTHEFMTSMGVEIPTGTVVAQGVYASISGKLCAVYALNYAKMRSAAAGLVSLGGVRRITPVIIGRDFMVTPQFLREKFSAKTDRMIFPDPQQVVQLLDYQPDPDVPVAALATRTDLVSSVYAVSGATALSASCKLGLALAIGCSVLGLCIMAALAYLGAGQLLTPLRIMLYELVWLVPGWLITEWTRTV